MNKEDKNRIIHGQVYYQNRWMPIDKKLELEKQDRAKIEQGYVRYTGEWITIEEKLARTLPQQNQNIEPQQIVINQTYNQQTYNVDKRTVHEHDHKHIHVDAETLGHYAKSRSYLQPHDSNQAIENDTTGIVLENKLKQQKMIQKEKRDSSFLEDKREG